MNKNTFFGGEYSYLIPLLLCENNIGHVHSIFANGFNIKMGDSLIFIGTKKNGLLPFGVHLTPEDTSRAISHLTINENVFWNENILTLEFKEMSISLKNGTIFKNEPCPVNNNSLYKDQFANLKILLSSHDQSTGLEINIRKFLKKYEDNADINWSKEEQFILWLIDAILTNDPSLLEKTLRFILGRGRGLTPSGDDIMVGILAFDSITHFLPDKFFNKLSDLVEKEPITTDVSKEYLRYALKHEFSSTVTDLINLIGSNKPWLSDGPYKRLLEVGHSSGLDTLFGILIGMLVFHKGTEHF